MGIPGVYSGGAAPWLPAASQPFGTSLSSQTLSRGGRTDRLRHPAASPCRRLTFLREIGAEQVVLGILGQGLDVDGS